jgi:ferredoxin-type protein NapH
MKLLNQISVFIFLIGFLLFTSVIFLGKYEVTEKNVSEFLLENEINNDTIQNGFISVISKTGLKDKIYFNQFKFIGDLKFSIAQHNQLISEKLIEKDGIVSEEIDQLYIAIQKEGKINYSKEILSQIFTEKKQKLLEEQTSWMFSSEKQYPDLAAFQKDFEAKINEINGNIGTAYHLKNDADTLLKMTQSFNEGIVTKNKGLWLFLTFGLITIGAFVYHLTNIKLLGPKGIKNNGIFQNALTNRGWLAYLVFGYLVGFYIVLYFFPYYLNNLVTLVSPISESLSGNPASHWFLYGLMYCFAMTLMAIRMFVKYRNNNYQILRTSVVLFFQIAFAFLIPEILVRFNMPYYDFKNAWPLDYDFFFDWNINNLMSSGKVGIFMLVWSIVLTIIIVPIMVYFFGKRWYCSWVCGCGGLAETLGDPYRQHSDKSLKAWKIERWLVHGVLVFAIIMTGATLYTFFSEATSLFGIETYTLQKSYGFLIGAVFSGVIGTGFYPIMGNRVWCRFGCPLAAYLGLVQRFKSKFRITTNGGQCISCGNCSTYCEQGIDVRAYAQKGEDIVRSSCVGCGICSAVCPRGVLKLENSNAPKKIDDNPLIFENNMFKINPSSE